MNKSAERLCVTHVKTVNALSVLLSTRPHSVSFPEDGSQHRMHTYYGLSCLIFVETNCMAARMVPALQKRKQCLQPRGGRQGHAVAQLGLRSSHANRWLCHRQTIFVREFGNTEGPYKGDRGSLLRPLLRQQGSGSELGCNKSLQINPIWIPLVSQERLKT